MSNLKYLVIDFGQNARKHDTNFSFWYNSLMASLGQHTVGMSQCFRNGTYPNEPWIPLHCNTTLHGLDTFRLADVLVGHRSVSVTLGGNDRPIEVWEMADEMNYLENDTYTYHLGKVPELIRVVRPLEKESEEEMTGMMDKAMRSMCQLMGSIRRTVMPSWEYLKGEDGSDGPFKCGGCGGQYHLVIACHLLNQTKQSRSYIMRPLTDLKLDRLRRKGQDRM